ncbi:MAG: DUF4416 family protein [Sphaerochaeta sp.]
MACQRLFLPYRLVMGVLVSERGILSTVKERLTEQYGPVFSETIPEPFRYTDYYNEEMGGTPLRLYLCFLHLVDPARLASIKMETNSLEQEFSEQGSRRVNLDPGLLSSANLILATTKNRSHRIPLQDGIYGELTLLYARKHFQSFPWTYADYKSDEVKQLFSAWRGDYRRQLKQEGYI